MGFRSKDAVDNFVCIWKGKTLDLMPSSECSIREYRNVLPWRYLEPPIDVRKGKIAILFSSKDIQWYFLVNGSFDYMSYEYQFYVHFKMFIALTIIPHVTITESCFWTVAQHKMLKCLIILNSSPQRYLNLWRKKYIYQNLIILESLRSM